MGNIPTSSHIYFGGFMKKHKKKKSGGLRMALNAGGEPVLIGYKEWLIKRDLKEKNKA